MVAWNWGASGGHRATGPRLQARRVRRREVGEPEPGGESSLSEVMLIFQAGEKRIDARAGQLIGSPPLCMNHCGEDGVAYDSPPKPDVLWRRGRRQLFIQGLFPQPAGFSLLFSPMAASGAVTAFCQDGLLL